MPHRRPWKAGPDRWIQCAVLHKCQDMQVSIQSLNKNHLYVIILQPGTLTVVLSGRELHRGRRSVPAVRNAVMQRQHEHSVSINWSPAPHWHELQHPRSGLLKQLSHREKKGSRRAFFFFRVFPTKSLTRAIDLKRTGFVSFKSEKDEAKKKKRDKMMVRISATHLHR